jgi:hypothetical protein
MRDQCSAGRSYPAPGNFFAEDTADKDAPLCVIRHGTSASYPAFPGTRWLIHWTLLGRNELGVDPSPRSQISSVEFPAYVGVPLFTSHDEE